ncbi:Acyl-homoserine lactone acylase QuiP [Emticicia aquatica]|uniref:Acyl-homoserine lactone acylase QuiP n=1 Tax=Emticicia aquatica TaxID=1681835 RepID=A0ABM9ATW6_9BACT|nr:penicillin acylase family protein [Emticicia aquatica]CAH0997403.1 Acyl-homoserine lactone acylase QuiP [Emticicia aquatica]
MKFVKFIVSLIAALGLTLLLNGPLGSIPALGRLFSPFEGFWQNGEDKTTLPPANLQLEGVNDEVNIVFDDNRVPHVFAKNDHDVYFAQGYLVARDRLWQMEFYTLAASGRLSEVVGERALELDRYNRRMGMADAAKKVYENGKTNKIFDEVLNAYSAGVNAYIKQLKYKDLPVEYKIIGYQPEEWSPYKTILMMMNMRNVLNGGSDDFRMTNALSKYGMDVVKDLFPDYPSNESPIIPTGTKWNFTPVSVPQTPAQITANLSTSESVAFNIPSHSPEIGSNNWAVGGEKSATGLPILANDPHLQLTLPSIWYQMQLSTPTMNVYGACLPGAPGVVIGFNKDVAWGVTNVGSDVMDFYQIKFKNNSKKEYWYNGAWKPTTMRVEEFVVKGKKEPLKDTVYSTHHGPIVYNIASEKNLNQNVPVSHAMRWVALEKDGTDLMAFYYLNRAKNYDDYRKALTYYIAPAQNFIFASNSNDIAITPNGKLPLKWKEQGKFIMDGSNPAHDWQGWIPTEQNPTVKNPSRGFVSSANQFSADPTYPYYLGWKFAPSERAIRINERLEKMQKATIDSLRMLQNDNFNVEARRILPELIKILNTDASLKNSSAYQTLAKWNMKNDANEIGATIFERWVREIRYAIWEDDFSMKNDKSPMNYPSRDRTWELIVKQPTAQWFDNTTTKDKHETMQDIVKSSFQASIDSLTKKFGPMNASTWAWTNVKSTDINHLGRLAGFGRQDIPNGGGSGIVNATTELNGPSWRMVVQLDKGWPKAYGLYPGGQSGNPASHFYDNMIDKWAKGELNELLFMKSKDEKSSRISATMTILKK